MANKQISQLNPKPTPVAATDQVGIDDNLAVAYKITVANLQTYFNGQYVPITGGTMTGFLILNANPVLALGAATKQYVDSQVVSGGSNRVAWVATTANLTAVYDNGTLGEGRTLTNNGAQTTLSIDGVALTVGKKVLVKDQSSTFQNGLYVVTDIGSGATNWVLTGDELADTANEMLPGSETTIAYGTLNGLTQWLQTTTVVTVGTDPVLYQYNIIAGTGLTRTNNTIALTVPVTMANGGTNANLTAALGAIPYSTAGAIALLAPVSTAGHMFQSGANDAPTWSTPTWPSASGVSGSIIISDGTNNIYSTSLWPNTVGTAGKIVLSNGTSNIYSTPTWPTSAGTAGSVVISDGTNKINSTSLWPNTVGTVGKIVRSDGTVNAYSTSTFADTYALNAILYASSANVVTGLATATNGVLITDGTTGIPSISSTLPTAVQGNITQLGAQSQALNMNSHLINNVTDPVSNQDAATKFYVDQTALTGTSVYAASAASLGTVTQSGAGIGATLTNAGAQAVFSIDGVSPPAGSSVLIKDTATGMGAANEGIYTVTNVGSGSTNWVLTRDVDYDTPEQINDTGLIIVRHGSTLAGTAWYNAVTIVTVDTTAFSFSQFGTGGTITSITVGQNLTGSANPITTSGTITGNFQNNFVIGGNFDTNPWQRGVSFALSTAQGYTADGFFWANNGGVGGVTITQTADAPTVVQAGMLVNNCFKIAVTTADASIAAGDLYSLFYKFEGYDWAQLAQQAFILSFWVKATVTGTYTVGFNNATDRSYIGEYTVNTTLTWEYKTIAVSASPSAGTWNYTNAEGLRMCFNLATGSTWNTAAGSWTTGGPFFGSSNQVNAMSSNTNIFELALIKVEPGTIATQYPLELAGVVKERSQRYYESGMTIGKYFSDATSGYSNESEDSLACFNGNGGATVYYRTTKRANPTFSIKAHDGTAGKVLLQTVGNVTPSAINAGANICTLTVAGATQAMNFYWEADASL